MYDFMAVTHLSPLSKDIHAPIPGSYKDVYVTWQKGFANPALSGLSQSRDKNS